MQLTTRSGSFLLATATLSTALVAGAGTVAVANVEQPCAAPAPQSFEMAYIDETRAGGEPILDTNDDGQLLWGSHAGTTHFYAPEAASATTAAFAENYQGQTYYYVSEDGQAWDFVPRDPVAGVTAGLPATGFSDPEFAVESDGTIYVSEINLANIAVSKSEDGGRSYELVNVFSFTSSDRQWMAADGDGELYMAANGFGGGPFPGGAVGNLGHFMAKSTDGGLTWGGASLTNPGGTGDIQIDHDRGILYELSEGGGVLEMGVFSNIREETTDFTVERHRISDDADLVSQIDPTFDLDDEGNLYVTWPHNPAGDEESQGIYYAYSTDQGVTWSEAVRIDTTAEDDVWPWIAVGEPGQVAITWLQSSEATSAARGGEAGGADAAWNVMVAHSDSGLGCDGSSDAAFSVVEASSEPVHTGTICQHGTTCQADLTDRRLGDYHSVEVDGEGRVHVAVADTRQGGATALPLHIRQVDGPLLVGADAGDVPAVPVAAAPDAGGQLVTASDRVLAATGGGAGLAAVAMLGAAVATRRRRG